MFERYVRQTILPEVSLDGQARINDTKILVAGAGGLASSALQFLVGAGCSNLTIYDRDIVNETNLHRQTIYNENHVGLKKVKIAKKLLTKLNSNCDIKAVTQNINAINASKIVNKHDLILDCGDNFALSYILSDVCYSLKKPLFSASAIRFDGYVGGFCEFGPSLRAVFPNLPDNIENCNTAGVFGPVVGVLGSLQAQLAINYILGLTPKPIGQMISINLKSYHFSKFRFDQANEPKKSNFKFIDLCQIKKNDVVIELRDNKEMPILKTNNTIRIPLHEVMERIVEFDQNQRLVFICRSGVRSWNAAKSVEDKWRNTISLIADDTNY